MELGPPRSETDDLLPSMDETSSPNNFRIKMCPVTQRGKVLPQKLAVVQLVFKFIPKFTGAPLAGTNPPLLTPTGHRNASQNDCSTEITVQNKAAVCTRVARVK